MRIDSSGRVLIGTTTSAGVASDLKLQVFAPSDGSMIVGQSNTSASGTATVNFAPSNSTTGAQIVCTAEEDFSTSANRTGRLSFITRKDGTLTERMRIDSSGNVLIGVTTTGSTSEGMTVRPGNESTLFRDSGIVALVGGGQSGQKLIEFRHGGAGIGSISKDGTTGTQYLTSSDYRLKENAVAISDGITRLKTLKPYRFNFKAEPDKTVDGFFAHEVTTVPEAITGVKDEVETTYYDEGDTLPEGKAIGDVKNTDSPVYQGIDQSKLVPLLVAAVQELIAKVEALEAA